MPRRYYHTLAIFWLLGNSIIDNMLDHLQISQNAAELSFNSKGCCKENIFAKENGCRSISISSENQPHHFVVVLLPVNYSWYMSRIHHYEQRTLPPPTFSHIFRRLTICRNWAESNRGRNYYWTTQCLALNSLKYFGRLTFIPILPSSSAIIIPLSINLVSCSTRLSQYLFNRETWFRNVPQ